jgi:pimeloyl-ACP methyl ester carboxylesterase
MGSETIRRGFVDITEGQVHYRTAGRPSPGALPLVMLHASPGSSKMLEPLIARLAADRQVIAPDTLGNGDSSPPSRSDPDIAYFADAHLRALDALGIERFDAYGSHTGANVACELAIRCPDRMRRLVVDGISNYTDAERDDMLRNHAPAVEIDAQGRYLDWVWHFVRDGYLFFPWYKHDAAHRRNIGLPAPDVLYDKVLEVLKAARTYHLSYRAALAYPKTEKMPQIRVPTLLACGRTDMLLKYLDSVAKLVPAARTAVTPGVGTPEAVAETAAVFREFLDAGGEPRG